MTMHTATTSRRIADGVTSAFVRDLSRHSARAATDGRRPAGRDHRVAAPHVAESHIGAPHVGAPRFGRDRDDCGHRRREPAVA